MVEDNNCLWNKLFVFSIPILLNFSPDYSECDHRQWKLYRAQSWQNAEWKCALDKKQLAVLRSRADWKCFNQQLTKAGLSLSKRVWIGFHELPGSTTKYQWMDGQAVSSSTSLYKWSASWLEKVKSSDRCGQSINSRWSTRSGCSAKLPFVCQSCTDGELHLQRLKDPYQERNSFRLKTRLFSHVRGRRQLPAFIFKRTMFV